MKSLLRIVLTAAALVAASTVSQAQIPGYAASAGIASKLSVRGSLQGLQVFDLRSQVRNEVIVVQAEIQNLIEGDSRLYYRFRWVDSGGMQVGDGEVWKPLLILGRQSQFIRGTAPGPKAVDFLLEMSAEPR